MQAGAGPIDAPAPPRQRLRPLRALFQLGLSLYGLAVTSGLLLGLLFGDRFVITALYHSFAQLFWLGALALFVLALVTRSWISALLLALPAAAFLWVYGGLFISAPPHEPLGGPTFTLLSYNIQWRRGGDYQPAVDVIRQQNADIVALQEVSPQAAQAIEAALSSRYPYMALHPQERGFDGQAVLSRYPIVADDFFLRGFGQQRTIIAVDGVPVILYNVHLATPLLVRDGRRRFDISMREREVLEIVERVNREEASARVLVVGDFNLTDRSTDYFHLTRDAGLIDAHMRHGSGLGWTWAYLPRILPPLLRIDYLFYRPYGLNSLQIRVVPNSGGSDHQPLWGQFQIYDPTLSTAR